MTDTTAEPTVEPATAPAPTPPAPPSARSRWAWRIGSLLVVALALGILYWGSSRAETTQPTGTGDLVVQQLFPGDGAKALRQTEVGADLKAGFDGRLTVNGIEIPEDEMEGVVDPASPEAARLPPEQADVLRPNNRNRVFFSPGPGKVIEKLPQGETTITVTYFVDGQPTVGRGSLTWTIDVD